MEKTGAARNWLHAGPSPFRVPSLALIAVFFFLLLLVLALQPAAAQTAAVCDRSADVRDAIVEASNVGSAKNSGTVANLGRQ